MPSARDDGVPADSDSISKNEEQEILCDQRCHINSRVHRACVARTTVVIATLIITGVALLLSVSSWHKKEDDVTAVLLLSTQGSINTSVTLGDSRSVTEAMTDPEIASQELSTSFMKMKTDEASTSTTPVPPLQTTETNFGLKTFLKLPNCSQELDPEEEEGMRSAPTVPGRVTFGRRGSGPGEFDWPRGVVVSPANEIFVSDVRNRRIQVHNLSGAHLRMFPTLVPGDENQLMKPYFITMDSEGHLWVMGLTNVDPMAMTVRYIVQYTSSGCVKGGFSIGKVYLTVGGMVIDKRNNNIVVTGFDPSWLFVAALRRDGVVLHTYRARQTGGSFKSVDVDYHGNVYTFHSGTNYVYVFTSSLSLFHKFKGARGAQSKINYSLMGLCVTSSGYVLTINLGHKRVEMYTRNGQFVRYVYTGGVRYVFSIAIGPAGQLIITDNVSNTITILPHYY
ncbi:uncharacterized protein LOC144905149 [Branchiostoma floridae x Branchiostoma belcheri]